MNRRDAVIGASRAQHCILPTAFSAEANNGYASLHRGPHRPLPPWVGKTWA